jgi:hypothetical protein
MKSSLTHTASKRRLLSILTAAATVLTFASHTLAQFTVTVTVDEHGNGTVTNNAGGSGVSPFSVGLDPGPGGLANALTYGLLNPPGLVAGDLLLFEPGSPGVLSDVIRFNTDQNGGSLVFYSDNLDGTDSLADTGFPTGFYANTFSAIEVGPEGNNGFSYTPGVGEPGFVTGAAGPVTYVIISEVPEPGILALCGVGLCMAVVLRDGAARRRWHSWRNCS